MQTLNTRHLSIFLAIVECGSFTAAAAKLPMAQPAVSLAMQNLEEALGAKLFTREKTGVTLTDEGRVLLPHAQAVMAQMATARREIAAFRGLEAGHVAIGAPAMIASYLLVAPITRFRLAYPGITLTIRQAGAREIEQQIRAGTLDMGLTSDWQPDDDLHIERIGRRPMVACVAKSSRLPRRTPLTWEQLFAQPLILFPKGYHQRQLLEHVSTRDGFHMNTVMEVETVPLMMSLVEQNLGVTIVMDVAAEANRERVARIALPTEAQVPIALCRRKLSPLSQAGEMLWSFLQEEQDP
jgi:DNA-binding transcriptional LysR family regulator